MNLEIKKHFTILSQDWLASTLILLSSLLLGVWAIKNTIALRNILLYLGAVLAIVYLVRWYRTGLLRSYFHRSNTIAIALLALMFVWVVLHYCFFSQYPQIQWHELKSTWLRAFLASLIGAATAIAVSRRPNYLPVVFVGILISFFALFAQYIDRVRASSSLFAPDIYRYIYFGKINAALMGSILLAAASGILLDQMVKLKHAPTKNLRQRIFWCFIFWLISAAIILYLNIYALDSRVGFGIAALLIVCTLLSMPLIWISELWKLKRSLRITLLIFILMLSLSFGGAIYSQLTKQTGWRTLIEDAQIAIQVEKYPHWQNLAQRAFQYPKADNGRMVQANTYERVAWFIVGCKLIPQNILGVGILDRPFPRILKDRYPELTAPSTHSAWVEFALAYGVPGVLIIFGSLLMAMLPIKNSANYTFKLMCGVLLASLFLIGELSSGHAVEILFYLIAFLALTIK